MLNLIFVTLILGQTVVIAYLIKDIERMRDEIRELRKHKELKKMDGDGNTIKKENEVLEENVV